MTPSLPPELLFPIVEEFAADGFSGPHTTTLCALCLTSHAFLPFARAALYRKVTLVFFDRDESLSEEEIAAGCTGIRTIQDELYFVAVDGDRLVARLQDSPHLAKLVRHISLDYDRKIMIADDLSTYFTQLLCRVCRNIDRLHVKGRYRTSEVSAVGRQLATSGLALVELVSLVSHPVVNLMEQSPGLKHLSVIHVQDDEAPTPVEHRLASAAIPFSLVTLNWATSKDGPFSTVISGSHHTLARLALPMSTFLLAAAHLSSFPSLRHLEVRALGSNLDIESRSGTDLGPALALCTQISTLAIAHRNVSTSSSFLAQLPRQLISFRHSGEIDFLGLTTLLEDIGRPSLRQVVVVLASCSERAEIRATKLGWTVRREGSLVRWWR